VRDRGDHRIFVAVAPPADVGEALFQWARAQRRTVRGLRPVPADHVHLTLAFLGERTAREVDAVAAALPEALARWDDGRGPLRLALGAPAWLPPRRPRALAVDVHDDDGRLRALHDALAATLEQAIGWTPERPLRPHLTAGRMRGEPGRATALDPTPARTFAAQALVLHRSTLGPAGARYERLAQVAL